MLKTAKYELLTLFIHFIDIYSKTRQVGIKESGLRLSPPYELQNKKYRIHTDYDTIYTR
jgi:hypothetical protein